MHAISLRDFTRPIYKIIQKMFESKGIDFHLMQGGFTGYPPEELELLIFMAILFYPVYYWNYVQFQSSHFF